MHQSTLLRKLQRKYASVCESIFTVAHRYDYWFLLREHIILIEVSFLSLDVYFNLTFRIRLLLLQTYIKPVALSLICTRFVLEDSLRFVDSGTDEEDRYWSTPPVSPSWCPTIKEAKGNSREQTVYILTKARLVLCMSEEEVIEFETSNWNKHREREKKFQSIDMTSVIRNYSCCWHARSLDLSNSSPDRKFCRWVRISFFSIR